jgi:hypothetical protein
MTIRLALVLLPIFALAACSSSSSPSGEGPGDAGSNTDSGTGVGDAADDASGTLLAPPPAGQGVQYTMSTTIAAASEDERCQFVQTTEDLWVNSEAIRYTPGSHHFILWNTSYTSIPTVNNDGQTIDTTKVFDCVGGPAVEWKVDQFVGGAQSANAATMLSDLPPSVALHIAAGSVLMMDLHVLNASPTAMNPNVYINLNTIPKSQVTQEAGIYFFYNPFILVLPNASAHARMSCPATSNVTLTTGQTHMHKWGLGGTASLEDSSGNVVQKLYTSTVWEDPPVTLWPAGTLTLQAGQRIDYSCNYENTGTTDVIQGPSAAVNEMCVFAGAYYPRDPKFETCSTSGSWDDLSNAATYIGTGTATCAATLECIQGAMGQQTSDALFGCMVNSCPGVASPLTAAFDCISANGNDAQTKCAAQISACEAASCN